MYNPNIMKKVIIFALFVLPYSLFAQYPSKYFSLALTDSIKSLNLEINTSEKQQIGLDIGDSIYYFSVSGNMSLHAKDGYVRVLLRDSYDYDFLVYENYELLSETKSTFFQNVAIETLNLDGIKAKQLIVEAFHASISIDKVCFSTRQVKRKVANIRKSQIESLVTTMNNHLTERNMTWRAGHTRIAEMSYEDKKALFGGTVPQLYGFEFYTGGVFVIPDSITDNGFRNGDEAVAQYVNEWDWRNRHGKNWMTPVKDQGDCGSCWAFSAIGTVEPYVNLYYNQLINMDLSEQEIVSCTTSNGCGGGNRTRAFYYMKYHGVVNEACFPYAAANISCSEKCQNPTENVKIARYSLIVCDENQIKQKLFIAPLSFGVSSWRHALVLAGYKTIQDGERIYIKATDVGDLSGWITIDSIDHPSLIGKTAWLLKNSWGDDWGDGGYAYVYINVRNLDFTNCVEGNVTSLCYSDSDVVCEDADGDGYYFWGIGPRPANCPSWVPDTPDGDDSNYAAGPLDEFGYLIDLNPDLSDTIFVSTTKTISQRAFLYQHHVVEAGGLFQILSDVDVYGSVQIDVRAGGTLIVDGGLLKNAKISLQPGSVMEILNNGKIELRAGCDFVAPAGAVVRMDSGIISPFVQ